MPSRSIGVASVLAVLGAACAPSYAKEPRASLGDASADERASADGANDTGDDDGGHDDNPLAATVSLPLAGAHDIQPFAFGQNYWNWEPTWGHAIKGTDGLVKAAGVKLIRAGGATSTLGGIRRRPATKSCGNIARPSRRCAAASLTSPNVISTRRSRA